MPNHWTPDGVLVVEEKTHLKPVGWLINGGPNDGLMVKEITDALKAVRHGSFSPLYIQLDYS